MATREPAVEQQDAETAPRTGSAAPPSTAPLAARVLTLQRSAGNRAVVQALARWPHNYLGTNVPVPQPGSSTAVHLDQPTAIDPIATAARLRTALESEIQHHAEELEALRTAPRPTTRREIAQRRARTRAVQSALTTARNDRRALDRGRLTVPRLEAIARRNELMVEPATRATTGRGETSSASVTPTGVTVTGTSTEARELSDSAIEDRSSAWSLSSESGLTNTRTTTVNTVDERAGTARRDRTTLTGAVDLNSATLTAGQSVRNTAADGSSTQRSTTVSGGISGGGGRVTATGSVTVASEATDAAGDTTSRETTFTSATSAVHGESGSGVAAEQSVEHTTSSGGVQVVRRASADGRFTVNLARDSNDPLKWRVVFAFHVGGSGRLGASRDIEATEAGMRGGGSVAAQLGADLTITRVLTETQLVEQLGVDIAAIQSGHDTADRADVGLEGRVRALFGNLDMLLNAGANFSSSSARGLVDGESVELSGTAGVDLAGNAGYGSGGPAASRGSIGVSGSVGATRSRAMKVARRGDRIVVTITLSAEERATLGVTGSFEVVSMGVEGSGSDTRARSLTFKFDPGAADFEQRFGELRGCLTLEQLQHFAGANPSLVDSRTSIDGETRGLSTTAGVAGVSLGINETSSTSREVTRGRDAQGNAQLTGTMTGSHTGGADLGVLGTRFVRGSSTSSATGTVDESGDLTLDVSQSQDETDLVQSVADAAERLDSRDTADNVADIAAQGLGGYLRSIAERTYSRLSGFNISQAHVDVIVRRAGEQGAWSRGVPSPRFNFQWMALRQVLVDPEPPQEWLGHDSSPDHRAAKNLFRAQALADFMAEAGDDGYEGVQYVLRFWGNSGWTEAYNQELGTMYEWPPSLAGTRSRYNGLKGRAEALPGQLRSFTAAQSEAGHRLCDEISTGLQQVLNEIERSEDFESQRAQIELAGTVRALRSTVSAARRNLDRRIEQAAQPAEPLRTEQDAMRADAAETAATRRIEQEEERERLKAQLRTYKVRERRLIEQARAELPVSEGGTLREEGWGGFVDEFRIDGDIAMEAMKQLMQVDRQWIAVIRQLRAVYRDLGTPESQWPISSGLASPRHPDMEPDIATLRRLYEKAGNHMQFFWSANDRGALLGNIDRLGEY